MRAKLSKFGNSRFFKILSAFKFRSCRSLKIREIPPYLGDMQERIARLKF